MKVPRKDLIGPVSELIDHAHCHEVTASLFEEAFGEGAHPNSTKPLVHATEVELATAIIVSALAEPELPPNIRYILSAISGALLNIKGSPVRLRLEATRRGPKLTTKAAKSYKIAKALTVKRMTDWFETQYSMRESAVAASCDFFKLSRSSVFAQIKLANEWLAMADEEKKSSVSDVFHEIDKTAFSLFEGQFSDNS